MPTERNIKRAKNVVWATAGRYDFSPAFLSFYRDGTPDLYENSIVGLTHRFYESEKLDAFFRELSDSFLAETFTDIVWLGIEHAVFLRAAPSHLALKELRAEHAQHFLADDVDLSMQELMMRRDIVHALAVGRCREVLTGKSGIRNPWERALYEALKYPVVWTTDEVIAGSRRVLRRFFRFRFSGALHAPRLVLGTWGKAIVKRLFPKCTVYRDAPFLEGAQIRAARKSRVEDIKGFFCRSRPFDERRRAEIEAEFGAMYYTDMQRIRLEKLLCTGVHSYAHLCYTKGTSRRAEAVNRAYFAAKGHRCRVALRKLTAMIKNTLDATCAPVPVRAGRGTFMPSFVWHAAAKLDRRVFSYEEEDVHADFSVILLLDGSASRKAQQGAVALQGYLLAKSLILCKIPVSLAAFSSLEGTTVIRVLKDFETGSAAAAFGYEAVGWNRDGLALLAAEPLFSHRMGKKLLLVLTDAHPADMLPLAGGALSHAYAGTRAVEDVKCAVQSLKKDGVKTIGLVTGVLNEADTASAAKEMFGKHFVCVRRIEDLAEKAGRLIAQEIRLL